MQEEVLSLLKQLVACESITPRSAGALELSGEYLQKSGFDIEMMPCEAVSNLWAWHGEGEPVFVFCGHVDVVPPGDKSAWSHDPFVPKVEQNRLYGRGATDMKAGVAAMLVAVSEFVKNDPAHSGKVGIMLTSDEEGDAINGIRHVVDTLLARKESFQYGLVGEPSSFERFGDTVRVGRRGSLTATIKVRGKQGHAAYPQWLSNPIPPLVQIAAKLSARQLAPASEQSGTTVQVVKLHADAGASNVVPQTAQAIVNIRYVPQEDKQKLKNRLEKICADTQFSFTCDWQEGAHPYSTGADSKLAGIVTDVCAVINGFSPEPSMGGGTSDGRFLVDLCAEVVEFGTVGKTMHQVDEYVEIAELEPLTQIYLQVVREILGQNTKPSHKG